MNWIISDVHGMYDQLVNLIDQIKKKDSDPTFWFVGDYCDRGPKSKEVVDYILALGDKAKCVRGNHDDMFHVVLTNEKSKASGLNGDDAAGEAFDWFFNYGLPETLMSYGKTIDEIKAAKGSLSKIKDLVSDISDEHRNFYKNLPFYIEGPDFLIIHACYPIQKTLDEIDSIDKEILIWSRFSPIDVQWEKKWNKTVYFGHTPTNYYPTLTDQYGIVKGDKISLIDTGSVYGGVLTAICHESQEIVQI